MQETAQQNTSALDENLLEKETPRCCSPVTYAWRFDVLIKVRQVVVTSLEVTMAPHGGA
jgi:hypothetical protein